MTFIDLRYLDSHDTAKDSGTVTAEEKKAADDAAAKKIADDAAAKKIADDAAAKKIADEAAAKKTDTGDAKTTDTGDTKTTDTTDKSGDVAKTDDATKTDDKDKVVVVEKPKVVDCSKFKLEGKSKNTQSKTWKFNYDVADTKNVVFKTWADAFNVVGDPKDCKLKEDSEPKECRSYVGDCVGKDFKTLEKPWLFEINQTPVGILYVKYCYECTTADGSVAS